MILAQSLAKRLFNVQILNPIVDLVIPFMEKLDWIGIGLGWIFN